MTRIGDLGRVVTGRTPSSARPEYFGTSFPFITPTDIQGDIRYVSTSRMISDEGMASLKRVMLPPQSVCVVCIGATIGKVCMTDRPSFSNQQINTIIVDQTRHDPRYVFAAVRLLQQELRLRASGAATPILNKTAFENVKIPTPDLETQKAIGRVLTGYDDLIEVNERRVSVLLEMMRRLFDEWFIERRSPSVRRTADGVDGDSEWRTVPMRKLIRLQYGKALPADTRRDGEVAVYGSSGQVGVHDEALVKGPGIIVGRKGNVGSVFWSSGDFYPIDTVYFVESTLPLRWVDQLLRRQTFVNSDAAVPGLNRDQAHSIDVVEPPEHLIVDYADLVEPLGSMADVLNAACARLRSARGVLTIKLVSGEVRVPDAPLVEAA